MTKEEMLKKLKAFVYGEYGSAKNYAEHLGVSTTFMSKVILGQSNPTKPILNDLGLTIKKETIVTFDEK